jgi:hypothetical protein
MPAISKTPTVAHYGESVTVTVSYERVRKGCDCCKQDLPTERFTGLLGSVLWICDSCFVFLTRWPPKQEQPCPTNP